MPRQSPSPKQNHPAEPSQDQPACSQQWIPMRENKWMWGGLSLANVSFFSWSFRQNSNTPHLNSQKPQRMAAPSSEEKEGRKTQWSKLRIFKIWREKGWAFSRVDNFLMITPIIIATIYLFCDQHSDTHFINLNIFNTKKSE